MVQQVIILFRQFKWDSPVYIFWEMVPTCSDLLIQHKPDFKMAQVGSNTGLKVIWYDIIRAGMKPCLGELSGLDSYLENTTDSE